MAKWKIYATLSFFIFLLGGGFFLYSQFSVDSSLATKQYKEYQNLVDSLEILDFKIRHEKNAHLITLHKDQAAFVRAKSNSLRSKLPSQAPTIQNQDKPKEESSSEMDLWLTNLKNAVLWTCLILAIFIVLLLVLLKKKRKAPPTTPPFPSQKPTPAPEPTPTNTSEDQLLAALDRLKAPQPQSSRPQKRKPSTLSPNSLEKDSFIDQLEEMKVSENPTPVAHVDIPSSDTPRPISPSSLSRIDEEDNGKSDILKLARRGYTSSEIARRLRISQDQVEFIVRMHRERG